MNDHCSERQLSLNESANEFQTWPQCVTARIMEWVTEFFPTTRGLGPVAGSEPPMNDYQDPLPLSKPIMSDECLLSSNESAMRNNDDEGPRPPSKQGNEDHCDFNICQQWSIATKIPLLLCGFQMVCSFIVIACMTVKWYLNLYILAVAFLSICTAGFIFGLEAFNIPQKMNRHEQWTCFLFSTDLVGCLSYLAALALACYHAAESPESHILHKPMLATAISCCLTIPWYFVPAIKNSWVALPKAICASMIDFLQQVLGVGVLMCLGAQWYVNYFAFTIAICAVITARATRCLEALNIPNIDLKWTRFLLFTNILWVVGYLISCGFAWDHAVNSPDPQILYQSAIAAVVFCFLACFVYLAAAVHNVYAIWWRPNLESNAV